MIAINPTSHLGFGVYLCTPSTPSSMETRVLLSSRDSRVLWDTSNSSTSAASRDPFGSFPRNASLVVLFVPQSAHQESAAFFSFFIRLIF